MTKRKKSSEYLLYLLLYLYLLKWIGVWGFVELCSVCIPNSAKITYDMTEEV